MPYFNLANQDCIALMAPEDLDATGIERIAEEAEASVIAHYTRDIAGRWDIGRNITFSSGSVGLPSLDGYTPIGGSLVVYLRYYCVDPANLGTTEAELAFLLAMRRTVAAVIQWRLLQETMNIAAVQETRGGRHLIKDWWQREPFPWGWDRWLKPFDLRPALTSL
jgi:hypothetical protein